jgi:hypothetical protein
MSARFSRANRPQCLPIEIERRVVAVGLIFTGLWSFGHDRMTRTGWRNDQSRPEKKEKTTAHAPEEFNRQNC